MMAVKKITSIALIQPIQLFNQYLSSARAGQLVLRIQCAPWPLPDGLVEEITSNPTVMQATE